MRGECDERGEGHTVTCTLYYYCCCCRAVLCYAVLFCSVLFCSLQTDPCKGGGMLMINGHLGALGVLVFFFGTVQIQKWACGERPVHAQTSGMVDWKIWWLYIK